MTAHPTTTLAPAEAQTTIEAEILPIPDLEDWGERLGIPVVPISPSCHLATLVAAGAPSWIAGDCGCCDDEELAFAVAHATQVIIADHAGRFGHVAAELALQGERVLLLDWPEGTPFALPGGNGGERHVK